MNRKLFAGVTAAVVLTAVISLSGQAAQTGAGFYLSEGMD